MLSGDRNVIEILNAIKNAPSTWIFNQLSVERQLSLSFTYVSGARQRRPLSPHLLNYVMDDNISSVMNGSEELIVELLLDNKERWGGAMLAFYHVHCFWKRCNGGLSMRGHVQNTSFRAPMLYDSETWSLHEADGRASSLVLTTGVAS